MAQFPDIPTEITGMTMEINIDQPVNIGQK